MAVNYSDLKSLIVCRASAGTGKTFTLSAYYVALLMAGENYRSILAVTFTNKATQEMKERILNHLYMLSLCAGPDSVLAEACRKQEQHFIKKIQDFLEGTGILHLSEDEIFHKASELFHTIMADYDGLCVTTIDSFLQTILTGLAHSLGKAAGFRLDLNTDYAITQAVDQIMSAHIEDQSGLCDSVFEYVRERMDNEDRWDIRGSLIQLAGELFKESVQKIESDIIFSGTTISAFKHAVSNWRNSPPFTDLASAATSPLIASLASDGVKYVKDFTSWFERIDNSLKSNFLATDDMFRNLTPRAVDYINDADKFGSSYQGMNNAKTVRSHLLKMVELCGQCRAEWMKWKYTSEYLNDMMLLNYIKRQMAANQLEDNTMLLADTAALLSNALKPGDADFILERAGLRYRHIMLDEFQDTSSLQWDNFLALIKEVLAGGGTTLIVGDIKQSIYRWRNGDWHIMQGLDSNHADLGQYIQLLDLNVNRRSRKAVVSFNLQTFDHLTGESQPDARFRMIYDEQYSKKDISQFYTESHQGGYVRLRAYPYISKGAESDSVLNHNNVRHTIAIEVFQTISALLERGAMPKDMLVLVRTKKEALPVIKAFHELRSQSGYTALQGIGLVSADSFMLDSSKAVNTIISALKYIYYDDISALRYVDLATGQSMVSVLQALNTETPLLDLVEQLIRLCLCQDGVYNGSDLAYLNCFKDKLRDYVSNYGANACALLTYWNDKMHAEAVAAPEQNAIRIMTIHSSKGLEANNVFIPFCDWEMEDNMGKLWCKSAIVPDDVSARLTYLPVKNSKHLLEAGYKEEYETEHADQRVDNLNLLYVALTRAADNLFIWTDLAVATGEKKRLPQNNVGYMLLDTHKMLNDIYNLFDSIHAGQNVDKQYIEYVTDVSSEPYIAAETSHAVDISSPFDFSHAKELGAAYTSDSMHIEFRQSQESVLYYENGFAMGVKSEDNRIFGNICHDILSRIKAPQDTQNVIDDFYRRGIIDSSEMLVQVSQTISRAWDNPLLRDWFSPHWHVWAEETIICMNNGVAMEYRPDRVMTSLDNKEAIVLDYKFGELHEQYNVQVRTYMNLLRDMGYVSVKGYLWAAKYARLVEVNLE